MKREQKIVRLLEKEYPDAKCALNYKNPLQLLIATILSAQCTDSRVNIVTADLFKKYKTAKDFANAKLEILASEIRSTGFFNNKARSIINCCKQLVERHEGIVPNSMDELVKLPGVARKTANVVLGNAFGMNEGIAVDTHVHRLARRLGLADDKNTDKVEMELMEMVPRENWSNFTHWMITHGRKVCHARNPDCQNCVLVGICESVDKTT